jgi:hypothetical protein
MSLIHPARTGATVAIWSVDGAPVRLVHESKRDRVTDRPTRLEDEHPDMAHCLDLTWWRFQATDADGVSLMFDVRKAGAEWRLIRVYD